MKRCLSNEKLINEFNKKLQNTCLESLSNEVLFEIFDYLEGCELIEAFKNLNSRFENLIHSLSLQLKIHLDLKSTDYQLANIVLPNRNRIVSLKFSTNFSFLPLDSSFHHLQVLILSNMKWNNSIPFLGNLANLPKLSSISMNFDFCPEELIYIYLTIFNLPVLMYNKISFSAYRIMDLVVSIPMPSINIERFSRIQYLNIDHGFRFDEFISIFPYTPELRRLNCNLLVDCDDDDDITTNLLKPIKTLTHITIENNDVIFDKLEIFLSKISPNVEILRLKCARDATNYLNADRWEKFITKNLLQLRIFDFSYQDVIDGDYDESIYQKTVNQFNSSFWNNKNWIFQISAEIDADNGTSIIYSIIPPKKSQVSKWNNSEANQLKLIDVSDYYWSEYFQSRIGSKLTTIDIYTLNIIKDKIFIGILIELIRYLPNLTNLIVVSLEMIHPRPLSTEELEILRTISKQNKITRIKLERVLDISQIHFLFQLCPLIEYLELHCTNEDLVINIVRSVLMKTSIYIPNLSILCIQTDQTSIIMNNLKQIIELERLSQNYTIEQNNDKIYLKY